MDPSAAVPRSRIPLALKVAYTAFVAVLVPVYWRHYGPGNFCYFCDIALLVTLAGIWAENPLLVSTQALAILVPQAFWLVDFLGQLLFGAGPLGMTGYMFDRNNPPFVRGLSLFHAWLPILLVYLVWKLGYDRRALGVWSVCGVGVLLFSYFVLPAPPPAGGSTQAVNVNYVYGLSNTAPQAYVHPLLWLAAMCVAFPLLVYWPTHVVLKRFFGGSRRQGQNGSP